jgi:hypothetical protein
MMRVGYAEQVWNKMVAEGASEADAKIIGHLANVASGRAELPQKLAKYTEALNAFFFSPKWQASRIELPKVLGQMILSDKSYIRKEGWRALITTMGGGVGILGLATMAGGKVELDPRSSDFGKLKIKDTRFDIWTGYAQYARLVAQLTTGQKKEQSGAITEANRLDVVTKFLQSKTSPAFGLVTDLLKGEDYSGKAVIPSDTQALLDEAWAKVMPLSIQDFKDALDQYGFNPLAVTTAAFSTFGVGTATYVNDFVLARNKIAKELGYNSWSDIDPIQQRRLERLPALQKAAIEYDRQMMGTMWGNWKTAGNAIEETFTNEVTLASDKFRQTGDGVQYRKDIQDAFTARRGGYNARSNDTQYAEIIERYNSPTDAEKLLKLGPEQMAIYTYEQALEGEDMYDEFGDYRFDEADIRKEQLKNSLGEELYNYVVEYKGLKYENLPVEFQELQKAKSVLKSYWDIRKEADGYFGEKDTPAKLRFIARRRKILRKINKEVEYYYNLFYVQQED